MIKVEYNLEKFNPIYFEQAIKLVDTLGTELIKTFRTTESDYSDLKLHLLIPLSHLLSVTSEDLRGKRILDLGCGSKTIPNPSPYPYGFTNTYEPWLCRFLALPQIGASPVGVDIRNNLGENFENHQADLTKPDSLSFLPDGSVDIAHAGNFYTLPEIDVEEINRNLLPQLERIVKPNGIFLYEDLTRS
jgi:SAM-dependent methyltransferase